MTPATEGPSRASKSPERVSVEEEAARSGARRSGAATADPPAVPDDPIHGGGQAREHAGDVAQRDQVPGRGEGLDEGREHAGDVAQRDQVHGRGEDLEAARKLAREDVAGRGRA